MPEPEMLQGDPDGNAKGGFVLLDEDFKVCRSTPGAQAHPCLHLCAMCCRVL